jgi:hypothetical protein
MPVDMDREIATALRRLRRDDPEMYAAVLLVIRRLVEKKSTE